MRGQPGHFNSVNRLAELQSNLEMLVVQGSKSYMLADHLKPRGLYE